MKSAACLSVYLTLCQPACPPACLPLALLSPCLPVRLLDCPLALLTSTACLSIFSPQGHLPLPRLPAVHLLACTLALLYFACLSVYLHAIRLPYCIPPACLPVSCLIPLSLPAFRLLTCPLTILYSAWLLYCRLPSVCLFGRPPAKNN